jgi:chromate transporter
MQRVAVEVQGWMTARQFTDIFAIAQVTPGPNVIIVSSSAILPRACPAH